MSSTFTLPLRLNTRQIPSNDGTLSPDTTGAAVITQQAVAAAGEPATIYLPAGSIIHNFQFYATTTDTSRSVTLDGNPIGTVPTSAAVNQVLPSDAALAANTGPATSVLVAAAGGDDSVGVFSVTYTGRNANGTITPYGSGLSNS